MQNGLVCEVAARIRVISSIKLIEEQLRCYLSVMQIDTELPLCYHGNMQAINDFCCQPCK